MPPAVQFGYCPYIKDLLDILILERAEDKQEEGILWEPLRDVRPGCGDMFQAALARRAENLGAGQQEGLSGW